MIRCIAIDDEPLALAQITGYIAATPFLTLTAACSNAIEATRIISETEEAADLLFVDINMPDMNGLDFIRSLACKPLVIFTTAYAEYALDGFRADALDYLLKPIGYTDFLRSAEKACKQYKLLMNEHPPVSAAETDTLFIKSGYKMIQIDLSAITHIQSLSEYLRIYADGISPVMTLGSMKSMTERLPAGHFMRVHRSFIVNLRKIISVERNGILISGNTRIPIGEQYKEAFQNHVTNYLL
jgi:two-component system LytT family response regulator